MADKERFMSIYPRSKSYTYLNGKITDIEPIPLRVVYDDGVEIETDIKFNKVTLEGNNKVFRNQSGSQDSFNVTVMFHRDDSFTGVSSKIDEGTHLPGKAQGDLLSALDYWIRNAEPFYVVTNAVGISQDELWLITEQKKRKQSRNDGYVEWDLTFTKYKKVNIGKFKQTSSGVKAAKKAYNKAKAKAKNKDKNKLWKCKREVLVYSKKKKTNDCVKTMQEILYKEGCFGKKAKKKDVVDGWYGKKTVEAVKAYQKKHKTDYGLKKTGKVDLLTYNALCGHPTSAKATVEITDTAGAIKSSTSKSKVGNKTVNVTNVNVKSTQKTVVGDLGKTKQKLSTVTVKSTSLKSQKNKTTKKTSKVKAGSLPKTSQKKSSKSSSKNAKKTSNKKTTKKK